MEKLSPEGLQLILDGEVGGGRTYYEKYCSRPVVPDPANTQSGVTIGIGYDLGANDVETFTREWGEYLTLDQLARLVPACGLHSMAAARYLPGVRDIVISWDAALDQFEQFSVPRYARFTESAFPGVSEAPQSVQEALLSLVFNRGPSTKGSRRSEMAAIRDLVAQRKWDGIPAQIRSMKRLWTRTPGLVKRREAEARFIEEGLALEPATD